MASSVMGLIKRNNQIPRMFTHYTRLLHPTIIAQKNFATEQPDGRTAAQMEERSSQSESKEVETLTEEIKQLKDKNDELLDKYKRSLADNENLRTRLMKQIEDAKVFGIQGFCKDLIEVADILEIAIVSVPKEELEGKNTQLKSLYEGLIMTNKTLQNVFSRNGLEKINPIKEKFNPNFHEALFQKDDATNEPNTVIEVSKIGYKLRERCIRPALVGVSKTT